MTSSASTDPSAIRTRFAPSPTGDLHVGSARTALFSWLFARHYGGTFLLRIEDTDRQRSTPEAIQVILEGMQWLGLNADEGPFYQTQRMDRYREVTEQLLASQKAYHCHCSQARVNELREAQKARGEKPRYDGHCRELGLAPKLGYSVVRFANPLSGSVIVDDRILGRVEFSNDELDDFIISRADQTPTYNFTVVVDDWDMQITDVIRGNDHLNNTPRQMNVLAALGATIPRYAHVPMIHGPDGKKLSKRHGADSVLHYRHEGYLPEALLNALVRLGWSQGDQEILSIEEMIAGFDGTHLSKSPAILDEQKLLWLNQHYLKTMPETEIATRLSGYLEELGADLAQGPNPVELVLALRERGKTLREIAEKSVVFYGEIEQYNEKSAAKHFTAESLPLLKAVNEQLNALTQWETASLEQFIQDFCAAHALKNMGLIAQPLRVALTGDTVSPPIGITLNLLGREKTLLRLRQAITIIEASLE